ncbi:hypothetical protein [Listeria monocytogenes]|uniref:hypothetical protein n=1 Tax=Listeria monocytogenes TaxID=1639 RepID=UPI003B42798A
MIHRKGEQVTVIKSSINASKVMRYVDNIPQKQLADLLLTSRPNVSHMQTGRRRMQTRYCNFSIK